MNAKRQSLSSLLSWSGGCITAAVLLLTGLAQIDAFREVYRQQSLDIIVFALMWCYLLLLPLLCGVALAIGDRTRMLIRSNFVSLSVWVVYVLWTLTLTL